MYRDGTNTQYMQYLITGWMGADSAAALKDAIYKLLCEKDVGMGLCQYIDLCFHASLPCLHTFWHAIPTRYFLAYTVTISPCNGVLLLTRR